MRRSFLTVPKQEFVRSELVLGILIKRLHSLMSDKGENERKYGKLNLTPLLVKKAGALSRGELFNGRPAHKIEWSCPALRSNYSTNPPKAEKEPYRLHLLCKSCVKARADCFTAPQNIHRLIEVMFYHLIPTMHPQS
jgi:hypothetical protein